MFDPILVLVDGSPHAHAAVLAAREIAEATRAHVVLLHAIEHTTPGIEADDIRWEEHVARGRALLAREARAFGQPVATRMAEGAPARVVARAVGEVNPGLVVLGSRGRGAIRGRLLGSVSRDVLRRVTHPTLVVHRARAATGTVLAGVEEGPEAAAVARAARAMADATGARLVLATIVRADPHMARHPTQYGMDPEEWRAAVRAQCERVFAPLRPATGGRAEERVCFGVPEYELRDLAREEDAGIVVVGRRGRSGTDVAGWFSVAFSLASRGPFATLVV